MPMILQGRDTVVAAETGSGKTLSYLAPVASLMLKQKERNKDNEKWVYAWIPLALRFRLVNGVPNSKRWSKVACTSAPRRLHKRQLPPSSPNNIT